MNEAPPPPAEPAPVVDVSLSLKMIDDIAKRAAYQGLPGTNYIDRHEIIRLCLIARNSTIQDGAIRLAIQKAEEATKCAIATASELMEGHAEAVTFRRAVKRMEAATLQRQDWIETARRNADLTGRILFAYRSLMNLVRKVRDAGENPFTQGMALKDCYDFEEANRPDVGE